ncbi:hypothetical protein GCM10010193_53970 [Kitasatospora atroaurantiaca]|uniref:PknH-like protein n=1 Tax=Kitasatospora atroaurantiaca TaxID=285545 RepID=A0A561EQ16_9ACTN|nr:hypothetical protein [Kitasatospora atroaurantiaca]TWE17713.1 hypothetical protein FB465_2751 [Kitasatospora atroaurantiaca]
MPTRSVRVLCCVLLAAGCTTVTPSDDRAAAPRELTAEQLRAAVLSDGDLGQGYVVTVMTPGHGETGPGNDRETADVPACQPVLDAVAPANPAAGPLAETDLSVARSADPGAAVYAGLLAFRPGRAAQLQDQLDKLLTQCTAFTSSTGGVQKGVRTKHRLTRLDTPTPEGADGATAFTLTNESGAVVLSQRALLARTGTALAVFSTVGVGKEPAPAPDDRVVRTQVAKLRKAQQG